MCTLCTLSKNCTFGTLRKMFITCALCMKVHKVQKVHGKNSHGMSGIKNDMAEMAEVAKVLPKLPLLPVQIFINNRIGLQMSKIFSNFAR